MQHYKYLSHAQKLRRGLECSVIDFNIQLLGHYSDMAINHFVSVFGILFVFRYMRLIVNLISYYNLRAKPVPLVADLEPKDVTVIIPTCSKAEYDFLRCLRTVCACNPAKIIVVAANYQVTLTEACLRNNKIENVTVLGVPYLNKRQQMVQGLKRVATKITIFADDDVLWPDENYLRYLLACFQDPNVGAAGTFQRVYRENDPNIWNFLAICYLERRNFNTAATNNIDGAVSTLSGRTAAYRTSLIQNEDFYEAFLNDQYLGKVLNTDDDKFLTRWTYSHNWDIAIQFDERAALETTMEFNCKYLSQCMRWARAHWRGNLTVMRTTNYWWKKHIWTLYAVYMGQFQTPALLWDGVLVWTLLKATASWSPRYRFWILWGYLGFLVTTKVVKLIPHFRRHPSDVKFLLLAVLFSYFHGFINIWALLTLGEVRFYTYAKRSQGSLRT